MIKIHQNSGERINWDKNHCAVALLVFSAEAKVRKTGSDIFKFLEGKNKCL